SVAASPRWSPGICWPSALPPFSASTCRCRDRTGWLSPACCALRSGSVPPSTALPHAGHCVSGWCLWRWLEHSAWPPGCPPTGECAHEAASEHDHPAHLGRPVAELAVVRGDLHRDPGLLRQGTGALDAPCPAWFIRPRQRQCTADQRLASGQRQRAAARLLDNAPMKLRQSMSSLRTWGGLLPIWLLFVVIFTGTLSCYDKELEHWMRPALHGSSGPASASAQQISDWLADNVSAPLHA